MFEMLTGFLLGILITLIIMSKTVNGFYKEIGDYQNKILELQDRVLYYQMYSLSLLDRAEIAQKKEL